MVLSLFWLSYSRLLLFTVFKYLSLLGIEQIVCLEEDGDAVLELLLGTQVETEHSLIPLVGILEGRNQGELGTREGRGQLRIPAILRILI